MHALGLRTRIALFFAALAAGAIALVLVGLFMGYRQTGGDPNGFVIAGVIAGFGIAGLAAAIWLLFDENVAKPIDRLAADLRIRAEADIDAGLDATSLKYLGDLGPAARALSAKIGGKTLEAAERVAEDTARLLTERESLTAILSGIPLAVLIVSDEHRITLYDGQAAHALEAVRPLCLGQSIFRYVDEAQLRHALGQVEPGATEALTLSTADGTRVFEANLRKFRRRAGYMLALQCEPNIHAERPLAFDFETCTLPVDSDLRSEPLESLTFVIFDTETTGLLPDKDEVVQIGAVRALGPRLVPGEEFETLVNPGRPIPRTSTAIHGIDDSMVRNAPTMRKAGERFLMFSDRAVLVAHNAPFDMAFLHRHARETGAVLDHPVLDTVLLGAELFAGADSLTLDSIASRLGVRIEDEVRHTALGDARATAAVFLRMLEVFRTRGVETLGDLISIQTAHAHILPDLNSQRATSV